MPHQQDKHPFYHRLSLTLVMLIAIGFILYTGKEILIPFLISVLLASLLLPGVTFLESKKFGKRISILIPVVVALALVIVVFYFFSTQISNFLTDYDALKSRLNELSWSVQKWINSNFHITIRKQNQYLNETVEKLKDQGPKLVGITVLSVTHLVSYVILLPIYTFLILYYRKSIHRFLIGVFKNGSEQRLTEILQQSTHITRKYILGLLIETGIVFGLNVIGFLIIGIRYAVFLALFAAILNLIPYVGILFANITCMLITLVSSDNPVDVIWVGVVLGIVQVIDNNFGMPLIVGNKIRLNALAIILGVLVGGAICGIPGMFLSIPGLAVLKVVFENIPSLEPWSYLLRDNHIAAKQS